MFTLNSLVKGLPKLGSPQLGSPRMVPPRLVHPARVMHDPPTSEGHNFFFRTPFRVFLDSMESPLSQNSIHMLVEGSRYWSWLEKGNSGRAGLGRLAG